MSISCFYSFRICLNRKLACIWLIPVAKSFRSMFNVTLYCHSAVILFKQCINNIKKFVCFENVSHISPKKKTSETISVKFNPLFILGRIIVSFIFLSLDFGFFCLSEIYGHLIFIHNFIYFFSFCLVSIFLLWIYWVRFYIHFVYNWD